MSWLWLDRGVNSISFSLKEAYWVVSRFRKYKPVAVIPEEPKEPLSEGELSGSLIINRISAVSFTLYLLLRTNRQIFKEQTASYSFSTNDSIKPHRQLPDPKLMVSSPEQSGIPSISMISGISYMSPG